MNVLLRLRAVRVHFAFNVGGALLVVATVTVACGSHRQSVPAKALAKANAVCARDDPVIAAAESSGSGSYSADAVTAILNEVNRIRAIRLGPQFEPIDRELVRGLAAILDPSAGRADANRHLQAARRKAAQLGLKCSFGALPSRVFGG